MKMRKILPLAVLGLGACAHEPIIDRKGVDENAYQRDLAECRAYAAEVDTVGETVKSGAVGAAVGGAVGAILGNGHDARRGVGVGTVAGGGKGLTESERRKQRVMYRCMEGRGYRVLG
jgi:outer membrane lipoprotein SlyB